VSVRGINFASFYILELLRQSDILFCFHFIYDSRRFTIVYNFTDIVLTYSNLLGVKLFKVLFE
jgi:hypothetical protein